jgi:3-oxoacyl-[acyl-carrier protein] reductase
MSRSARVGRSHYKLRRRKLLARPNRKIIPIPADLTKPTDAEAFVKEAHTALGRIDILVNNAGSAPGGFSSS